MKSKEKKSDIEFLKYQKYVREEFDKIINTGWDSKRFDFNMPPEFVLGLMLFHAVMDSPKLVDDAKKAWIESHKAFWDKIDPENPQKMFKGKGGDTNEIVKKSILH